MGQMQPQIGLGWGLESGGRITRIVNNLPDDINRVYRKLPGEYENEQFNVGFIYSGGSKAEVMCNTEYNDWDMDNNQCIDHIFYAGFNALDTEPDKFLIQFPGFSGEFYFDKDGVPHLVSSPGIKIEAHLSEDNNGRINSFDVYDMSGNRYVFDKLELTVNLSHFIWGDQYLLFIYDNSKTFGFPIYDLISLNGGFIDIFNNTELIDDLSGMSYVSTWHLSKIITPLDDEIEFSYISILGDTDERVLNYSINRWMTGVGNDNISDQVSASLRFTRKLIPWGIIWNGGEIKFSYNPTMSLRHFSINDKINDNIFGYEFNHSLFDADDTQRDYESLNFSGESIKNFNEWLKLDKINKYTATQEIDNRITNGVMKMYTDFVGYKKDNYEYSFQYNEQNQLPNQLSSEMDFWGFYNGNGAENSCPTVYDIDPDIQFNKKTEQSFYSLFNDENNTYPILYTGANRNSSEQYLKTGILEKIIYPTGGSTQFQYESNDFTCNGVTIKGAGLRIAKITINPIIGPAIIKEFEYIDNNLNCSSGKIINLPVFSHYNVKHMVTNYNVNGTKMTHGSFVGYSEVTVSEQDNGSTKYFYDLPATFEDNTHNCNNGNCVFDRPQGMIVFDCVDCLHEPINSLIPAPNYDWNRGQLLKKIQKDNFGDTVLETEYLYETSIQTEIPYVFTKNKTTFAYESCANCHPGKSFNFSRSSSDPTAISYLVGKTKKIIATKLLKEISTYIYGSETPSNIIQNKSTFVYNAFSQLISNENVLSNGKVETINNYYLNDINDPNEVFISQSVYNTMLERRIFNSILKTEKLIDSKIINSGISSFGFFNGDTPLPEKTRFLENGVYMVSANYDKYDIKNNPLQYHNEYGVNVTTLWGYNFQYPIAKIENANYDDVITAIGIEYDILQTKNSDELIGIFQLLIEDSKVQGHLLNNSVINAYTYDPLIGITSETDPNGKIIIYQYDEFQRLETIRDIDNNVLKHIDYNYGFNATLNNSSSYSHGEIATFSVGVQGGSGSFSFNWSISINGQSIATGTESTVTTQLTESGTYLINCLVTDNESNYTKTATSTFSVSKINCTFMDINENTIDGGFIKSYCKLWSPYNETVKLKVLNLYSATDIFIRIGNGPNQYLTGITMNFDAIFDNNSNNCDIKIFAPNSNEQDYIEVEIISVENNNTSIPPDSKKLKLNRPRPSQ
jgi:YD repeat-containing protein